MKSKKKNILTMLRNVPKEGAVKNNNFREFEISSGVELISISLLFVFLFIKFTPIKPRERVTFKFKKSESKSPTVIFAKMFFFSFSIILNAKTGGKLSFLILIFIITNKESNKPETNN